MALDPSIYAAFAPKQQSATDVMQSLADLDSRRSQNALQQLQQQMLQGQVGDAQQARGERNALQQLLADPGFSRTAPDAQQRLYRVAPSQAAGVIKGWQDQDKTAAEIDKAKAGTAKERAQAAKAFGEAQAEALKGFRGALDYIDTPAGAARWLQAQYANPLLADHMAALGPVDQAISRIPQDPAGFAQWRGQARMGMDKWAEQQRLQTQADETGRHNRATEANAAGQLAVSQGQLGVAQGNLAVARQREGREAAAPRGQFIQTPDGFVLADPRTGAVQPVIGPDGKPLQGKAADRALTEGQAKANMFGTRMQEADKIIGDLAAQGVRSPSFAQQITSGEGVTGQIATALASPQQQQIDQAQRDFINAVLRRESGAAIAKSEFENARKQYFVQPGDSRQVIEQKARNRRTAIDGMLAEVPESKRTKATGSGTSLPSADAIAAELARRGAQ